MAYQAPGIDASGIHVPEYTDIRDRLIATFKTIFGEDLYLGEDSQDYQMIAEFADLMDDVGAVLAQDYASHDPDLASGLSLDYLLALNGLRRMAATNSTAVVTASGTEGTLIRAGSIVMDANGNQWSTNADATIGSEGSVSIAVTAVEAGHISADAGSISKIMSPTAGWISVTNEEAANAGRDVETDGEARERRAASLSNTGMSMLEAIIGTVRSIAGVQKTRVYENDTSSTDGNGIPAHSICAVVLGGEDEEIATAIFKKKSPGCGTYGNNTETVQDIFGNNYSVKFSRPVETPIIVQMTVKTFSGYTSDVADAIKKNVKEYIESLQIGASLNVGMLWASVLAVNPDTAHPICTPVAIQAKTEDGSYQTATVEIDYDALMTCALSDITITAQE